MIRLPIFLLFFASTFASRLPLFTVQDIIQPTYDTDIKVPVELGVMSRCPDALLCENVFDKVLQKVQDKVTLSLRYVAKLDPSEPIFGVRCMHGQEECAGDVQQLCVAKYTPKPKWWEFVRCQNFEGKENIGQPSLALKCARVAGVDWEASGAGQCAGLDGSGKGPEGTGLLRASVALAQEFNITKSCTVIINGEKVCVHDGAWKECENGHFVEDFVRQIKEAYDRLNYGQL